MAKQIIVHRGDKTYTLTLTGVCQDERFIPHVADLMADAWSEEFPWPQPNTDPAIVWTRYWLSHGEIPDRPDDPVYYRAFEADGKLLDPKDGRTVAEVVLGDETHIYLLLPEEVSK